MPTPLPISHVEDALKLEADAELDFWEIMPSTGGSVFIKSDNEMTWLGDLYESVPISLSGEEWGTDGKTPTPRMTIGQENLDLLPFKGLIFDGHLDGARIVRRRVLLDNAINQRNIKQTTAFRVKRIEGYTRTKITLVLATYSAALGRKLPFRQYTPPAFPWVTI